MKKSNALTCYVLLAGLGLLWPTLYAIVGDFFPELETIEHVLGVKSVINGFVLMIATIFLPFAWSELEDD